MFIILLLYLIYFKKKFDLSKNWKPHPITSLFIILSDGMRDKIKSDIQRYIRLNLEDMIDQILCNADKVRLLSKRDLISIAKFMKEERIYSISMLEYAYTKSIHVYCSLPSLPDLDNDILMDAAERGNLDVIKLLLSNKIKDLFPKIDPSADDNYAIRSACCDDHIDVVKFLLSSEVLALFPNIDPSAKNNYAIIYASSRGCLDVVKFLLSSEVLALFPKLDPKAEYNKAIKLADRFHKKNIVEFLRIHVYNSAPLSDILQDKI